MPILFYLPEVILTNLMNPEVKTVSGFVNVYCVIHKRDLLQQYHMQDKCFNRKFYTGEKKSTNKVKVVFTPRY